MADKPEEKNLALQVMEEVYAKHAKLVEEAFEAALTDEEKWHALTPRQKMLGEAMRLPKKNAPLFMTEAIENVRYYGKLEADKRASSRPTVLIVLGSGVDDAATWAKKAAERQLEHDRERVAAIEAAVMDGATPGEAAKKVDEK